MMNRREHRGSQDCGKTHFQVPQRLKPPSYESTIAALEALRHPKPEFFPQSCEVVPFHHCANPRVFHPPLVLCPAPSRQKSGAVILGEAKGSCITNQL